MKAAKFINFVCIALSIIANFSIGDSALATPRPAYDLDGDKREDLTLWNPGTGVFTVVYQDGSAFSFQCGLPGDTPLTGNVTSSKKGSAIVWRPRATNQSSSFFICRQNQTPLEAQLGRAGDIPFAAEDFDGDGKADLTVWRPSTREWIKSLSSFLGHTMTFIFGEEGDIPTPGDYDGDGISQEAVFRPSTSEWYILNAGHRSMTIRQWGLATDIPVPADYDGDGLTDIAVWRPDSGIWYVIPSSSPKKPLTVSLGLPGDIPQPRDLDGDSHTDFVVFRPSTGEIFYKTSPKSKVLSLLVNAQYAKGTNSLREILALNDFDGDGRSDFSIIRNISGGLYWHTRFSATSKNTVTQWGLSGDTMMPSDYNGDSRTDYAVVRNVSGTLHWYINPSDGSSTATISFGFGGDTVAVGNIDYDKKADPMVIRANTSDLQWFALSSLNGETISTRWGKQGDQVVLGDFDGDGQTDPSIVREISGRLYWFTKTLMDKQLPGISWGLPGDLLVPADYDGDGKTDYAVLRSINGLLYLFLRTTSTIEYPPIQWGLSGDSFAPGNYRGSLTLQLAVWRNSENALFHVNNSPDAPYTISLGVASDTAIGLIIPQVVLGSPPTPSNPKPSSQDRSNTENICDTYLKSTDGPGGFVHKPISDSDGKLAVILAQKFGGNTNSLQLFDGNSLLENLRYIGDQNGGRPHFRAKKPGRNYPSNLIERWIAKDSKRYCIRIPNPGLRYD